MLLFLKVLKNRENHNFFSDFSDCKILEFINY